jgi:hypothetical protein
MPGYLSTKAAAEHLGVCTKTFRKMLAAMCQRRHLTYDAGLHTRNAQATLRARRASGDLLAGA